MVHTAGLSPAQASPEAIIAVDLVGVAFVLEEFGRIIASGGSGIVIASQAGHMLPPLPAEQNEALATDPGRRAGAVAISAARHSHQLGRRLRLGQACQHPARAGGQR